MYSRYDDGTLERRRAVWLEKDPSLCSALSSKLEYLYFKLCKITTPEPCVMGTLADSGIGLKTVILVLKGLSSIALVYVWSLLPTIIIFHILQCQLS